MSYATVDDLRERSAFYGVTIPDDAEHLLELATRDVQRALGAEWDPALLEPEQVDALREATVVQACFRASQGGELALGVDDGLAAIGGVSFSTRTPPRLSPEADEVLAGRGLFVRTGTVPLADAETP